MTVTATQFIILLLIAAVIGLIAEFLTGRRAPAGFLGSIMVGLFAIFLIVGYFKFQIDGEPTLEHVPIISTIIAAIMVVVIWTSLSYRRRV